MQWGLALQNSQGSCRSTETSAVLLWLRKSPMPLKCSDLCAKNLTGCEKAVFPRLVKNIQMQDTRNPEE